MSVSSERMRTGVHEDGELSLILSCGAVLGLPKRKNSCRFGVHSENLGYVYFLY